MDGRSLPGAKASFDVNISPTGGYTTDQKEAWTSSQNDEPIWIDNLLFHSLNIDTGWGFYVTRDTVMTNVSIAGSNMENKRAVFFGPANALHMEGVVAIHIYSKHRVMGSAERRPLVNMPTTSVVPVRDARGRNAVQLFGCCILFIPS